MATRTHTIIIGVLCFFLFMLNSLDATLTVYAIENLGAREANPLMKMLIDISPLLFFVFKVVLVSVCIGFMYWVRNVRPRITLALLAFAVFVYAVIDARSIYMIVSQ